MAKKIFSVLFALLLIAGILFGVCYFVGRRTEEEKRELGVQYNGKDVNDLKGLIASYNDPLVFDVTGEDYTIKVVPAENIKFTYLVDDKLFRLADLEDLTSGFTIDTAEDGTVTVKPRGSVASVLSVITGKTVTLPDGSNTAQDLFTIVFAQDDNEFRASFGLYKIDVDGVKLSESEVIF